MKTPTSISDFDPKKVLAHQPTKTITQEQKIILSTFIALFRTTQIDLQGIYFIANHDHIHLPTNQFGSSIIINTQTEQSEQRVRFPEDIQVIIRSDQLRSGNLFLSNLEAAQNIKILQSSQPP